MHGHMFSSEDSQTQGRCRHFVLESSILIGSHRIEAPFKAPKADGQL
jgi:hypothetical protein